MAMYRGLSTFISDIRNCKTKEQEQQRVDKELANVRKAFTSGRMSPYDRKKYVWKLVYINMLGYDIDFGHMEMIALVSCPSYAEKLVGYLTCSLLLKNTDEQITLVVQAIKSDLQSTQDPIQCLALAAIANIGGKDLAESVATDVQRILFSRSIFPVVRRKAALCLLRLVRISRDLLPAEEWAPKLVTLLEDRSLGVVLSVVTLLHGLAERDPGLYEQATGHLLVWLTRLAVQRQVSEDYVYHGTPCPWLQVRILRLLQQFPVPSSEAMRVRLNEVLGHILNRTEITKSVNRNNAEHCVLFEAVDLIIKQGEASDPDLRAKAAAHLSKFINIREPNIRYLGLEAMSRLTKLEGTAEAIRKQQATVFFSLKDADISIRRRALDLLFEMCDKSIAESIVRELLQYLAIAEWQIKDEMVLKIAILAERFAASPQWYVDTIVQLLALAGEFVSDDIWHRVVQIVTNNAELQKYAASKVYHALEPITAHETAVKMGGYILGEFGYLLNEGDVEGAAGSSGAPVTGAQQFAVLHQHFPRLSNSAKSILLSTYAKMVNLYPELRPLVRPVFDTLSTSIDAELQQRAVEYNGFFSVREDTLGSVLDAMPPFSERASMLENRLRRAQEEMQDKDVWGAADKPAAAGGGEGEEEGVEGGDALSAAARSRGASAVSAGVAEVPAGGDGGLDLLGLGSDMGSAAAPAAPAPAPAAPSVDAASVPVTTRVGIDAAAAGSVARWFAGLLAKPSGILFEDASLQIGVKRAVTGAEGTLTLFFGNKTQVPLVALRVRVPPMAAVQVTMGEVPSSIAPGAQVAIPVRLEAMQPFTEAPALQVSFISTPGTGHAYPLKLPIGVSTFCEPVSVTGPDFRSRWGALAGAPREATAAVAPASGAGAVTAAAAEAALTSIGMGAVDAGAPGPTGATSFRTHSVAAATGAYINAGGLAMVIPDAAGGVFKVAVRTQHPDVTASLMAQLQGYLAAL